MKVEVDEEANAAYVTLAARPVAATRRLDANRLLDLDAAGKVVGIELLNVSAGVDLSDLPDGDELATALGRKRISVRAGGLSS